MFDIFQPTDKNDRKVNYWQYRYKDITRIFIITLTRNSSDLRTGILPLGFTIKLSIIQLHKAQETDATKKTS